MPASIRAATFDHEGSLWVGTEDRALYRIKPTAVRMVADAVGALSNNVYPVIETRDGAVWYGTFAGDIVRVANGNARAIPGSAGNRWWIRSLLDGRDGRVRAGSALLYRCEPHILRCEPAPSPSPSAGVLGVLAIHEDAAGMWVGADGGLFRLERGTWRTMTAADGAPTTPVRVFLRTADGAL